jgi:predicted nucleic acid-binding protein
MIPDRIVLDAGPLISLAMLKDPDHENATRGFQALIQARVRPIIPEPVMFEVYKRLKYSTRSLNHNAQDVLRLMLDTLEVHFMTFEALLELEFIVNSMPRWNGSLEDAALVFVAREKKANVWTFNYRDLAAFQDLEFWTPST